MSESSTENSRENPTYDSRIESIQENPTYDSRIESIQENYNKLAQEISEIKKRFDSLLVFIENRVVMNDHVSPHIPFFGIADALWKKKWYGNMQTLYPKPDKISKGGITRKTKRQKYKKIYIK